MNARDWNRILVAMFAASALAACKDNPQFCEGNPDNDCQKDAAADSPTGCTSNAQCSAPTAVCDVGAKTCVECLAGQADACTGMKPTCGDDQTCRGCEAHAECTSSDVCLPDGACAVEDDVAYVAMGGTGTTCTKAAPCGTVATALATMRPFIKLAGTIDEAVTIGGGREVTLLGAPQAKLTRSGGTGAILTVRDDSTKVTVLDLTIADAPNNASGFGVVVPTASGAPVVVLTRVKIDNNPGGGISSSGGTLTVTQSTLSGNAGGGISMTAPGVVVITNNFIHHNGNTTTASFGGLSLRPMGVSAVEFNTIVDNQANLGAASAGGVFCDTTGFVAANNIIFRNTGGSDGGVQTFGNCTYGNSFKMPGATPADNTPAFANPNNQPYDYHLTAASPTTVRDAAGTCTGVDYDGDTRPGGTACDLGADEFKP